MHIDKVKKFNRIRPGRIKNKLYMVWIRTKPCLVDGCNRFDIDPHHPINSTKFESRRRFGKAHDIETVPICRQHHTELHDKIGDEQKFENKYGLDFKDAVTQYNGEWVE